MRLGFGNRGVVAHTGAMLCAVALLFAAKPARAAELEPRAYANAPVGLNFLIAGYAYSEGGPVNRHPACLTNMDFPVRFAFLVLLRSL
ncbi:MAG: hypothetical protein D4R80_01880 [Deltaproteobacteria bacterium]|nr:MAG: hypothetical protein D4R80_01880 [Deltaproteobacteria bacterium]